MILQEELLKNNHQTIQKTESLSDWIESQSNDILKDIPIDDERLDLPSASKIESYFLCPGKYLAEKGIPEEASTQYSERGKRIHEYLANPCQENLNILEKDDVNVAFNCKKQAKTLIEEWNPQNKQYILQCENRFWIKNKNGEKILSGKSDAIMICENKALIIDYKVGRYDATESARNEQLRTLAILLNEENPNIQDIRVAIVQPLVSNQPDICDYSDNEIKFSRLRLINLWVEIQYKSAKRIAGKKQCDFCKAKLNCPEANQTMIIPEIPKEVSAIQISDLLDRAVVADIMVNAIRAKAKEMAISGVQIPNYELKEGNEIRIIKDPQEAFKALQPFLTVDEFRECCSVKVGDIEDHLSEKLNLRGKKLKNKVAELLGDHMEIKKNSPSIKRI